MNKKKPQKKFLKNWLKKNLIKRDKIYSIKNKNYPC